MPVVPAPEPLRGVFGGAPVPPRTFGSVDEPAAPADAWTPQVGAPLRPRTPRWYRPNPNAFAWAAVWSLLLPVLGVVQAVRTGGLSAYVVGALFGVWASSTVLVGAAAYRSKHHWRWWLAYPVGVVLVAALRILVGSLVAPAP